MCIFNNDFLIYFLLENEEIFGWFLYRANIYPDL